MNWESFATMIAGVDWKGLLGTLASIAIAAFGVFRYGAREKALREQIQGDLALIEDLRKNEVFRLHTPTIGWLHGKVVVDVAKLAGVALGTKKRPIPWGALVFALLVALAMGWWTYDISKNGFAWPSLLTGSTALLFAISALGMTANREIPPDQRLPEGAVATRTDPGQEQVARQATLAATEQDPRFATNGPIGVALRVFELLQSGRYEEALSHTDPLWLECRIRSWLWRSQEEGAIDRSQDLNELLHAMIAERGSHELWRAFVESEEDEFASDFEPYGVVGAASYRRRMSRDTEMIIMAPMGDTSGYFVTTATALPESVVFLMRETDSGWALLNHGGPATPVASWPPVWWIVNDPAIGSEEPALDIPGDAPGESKIDGHAETAELPSPTSGGLAY